MSGSTLRAQPDKHLARKVGLRGWAVLFGLAFRQTADNEEAEMKLYAGIDLHSNNSVVVVLDADDRVVYSKRLANDLAAIVAALHGCAGQMQAVAVESTYNWRSEE